jgi:signal transduction histidine kinase
VSAERAKAGFELSRWQRPMLPGSMVDGTGARRTARDWAVDATLLALALGVGALVLGGTWGEHSPLGLVLDFAGGLLACGALWFRRRHPVGVAALVIAVSAVSGLAVGAAIVVVFNAAIRAGRGALAWIVLASLASAAVFSVIYPGKDSYMTNMLISALLIAIAVGWGLFARARRDLVGSLHERAERLEAEAQLHAEQAREGERRRIAREMHDVLAHRLSLLSLHAGALEFRPDAPPEEVATAAAVIRDSARAALEELREVIGVLREGTEAATQPAQPTLHDLRALVEEARAAGARVDLDLDPAGEDPWAPIPERNGRTAYRIVQEGLTNARKHAPGARVRVRVSARPSGEVGIEVANPRAVAAASPVPGAAAGDLPGSGSGLIGLGERVALVGGELSHGSGADGEYRLRATLPAAES